MGKPKKAPKPYKKREAQPQWKLVCNEDHTDCKAVRVDE